LSGEGAAIEGVRERLGSLLGTDVSSFNTQQLSRAKNLRVQTSNHIPMGSLVSMATAIGSPLTRDLNFKERDAEVDKLLNRQLLSVGSLILASLLTLLAFIFLNVRSLKQELSQAETQATDRLKKTFKIPPERKRLADMLDAARAEVAREENIWFSLSNQSKFSFLNYLQELSTKIDRQGIGLQLKRLSISDNAIILEGSVRDFNALIKLRQELERSTLFTLETTPQSIDFTTKPIRLIIKKEREAP
jgi:hypothetical protein